MLASENVVSKTDYYVVGGPVRRDAPSYVERQADTELYANLKKGEYCHVLTSRQMGKTSLLIRTAERLSAEGAAVAHVDLTQIGQNVTAEQWYRGILSQLGQELDLETELGNFWNEREYGPLQRLLQAMTQVVLRRHSAVIIFIDEIDVVRSLPFNTDEFFAGIRELYNRRVSNPELARLTFCLLGVLAPSDLIRDARTTPYNIGHRIELSDFSEVEAFPLANGLGREEPVGKALLTRILYWTGGQPYLTQRLCQAIAENPSISSDQEIDSACSELFLTSHAEKRDDNLVFVSKPFIRKTDEKVSDSSSSLREEDRVSLLTLYGQVRKYRGVVDRYSRNIFDIFRKAYRWVRGHEGVSEADTNPVVSTLQLSGIVKVLEGYLYVRNRIYYEVFDEDWITANLPGAEIRRQRAAYKRGLLRAAAVAGVVTLMLTVLSGYAWTQQQAAKGLADLALNKSHEAETALSKAIHEQQRAEGEAVRANQRTVELQDALRQITEGKEEIKKQQEIAKRERAHAEQERSQARLANLIAEEERKKASANLMKAEIQSKASAALLTSLKASDLKLREPNEIQKRASVAISSFLITPNPGASQIIAEALSSANHFIRRFKLNGKSIVSRNGRYVATSDDERRITVYEVGESLRKMWATPVGSFNVKAYISALAISNDGKHLAFNYDNLDDKNRLSVLSIFEAKRTSNGEMDAQELFRDTSRPGRNLRFDDVAFSPNGDYLWGLQAVIGLNATVPDPVVYHIQHSVEVLTIHNPSNTKSVYDIKVSDGSKYVALLTAQIGEEESSRLISVYSLPDLKLVKAIKTSTKYPHDIAFSPNEADLMMAGGPSSGESVSYTVINDWSSANPKITEISRDKLQSPIKDPQNFSFLSRPDLMLISSKTGPNSLGFLSVKQSPFVTLFNNWRSTPERAGHISNLGPAVEGRVNSGDITSIGVQPENNLLVTTDVGGYVTIWEPYIRYGTPHLKFNNQITDLSIPDSGNSILIADLDFTENEGPGYPNQLTVTSISDWNTLTPKLSRVLQIPYSEIAFSMDGKSVSAISFEERSDRRTSLPVIKIYSMEDSSVRRTLLFGEDRVSGLNETTKMKFSPDGRSLVLVDELGNVVVWDLTSVDPNPSTRLKIPGRFSSGRDIAFSQDSTVLVVAAGKEIQLWREWTSKSPTIITEIPEVGEVSELAVSYLDKYLAAGTDDGRVVVWRDWKNGKPVIARTIKTDNNPSFQMPARIMSIAFHPTEDVLAVLDRREVQVFGLAEDQPWLRLPRDSFDSAATVRFSSDGRYVLSTTYRSSDYVYWLWRPEDMIEDACRSFLLHDLSEEDWGKYVNYGRREPTCRSQGY